VVATDVGGIRESLQDDQEDFVMTPNACKALANALKRSVTDIELRRHLIKKSLEVGKANYLENQKGIIIYDIANMIRVNK
jgi:glycosyltransferase involved in cell wall biosynthesis